MLVELAVAPKRIDGKRIRFRAVVERFGTKTKWHGWPEKTILLRDITRVDSGQMVSDHLWFTVGSVWLGVHEGDTVEFDARVGGYEKGYVNEQAFIDERQGDYKLKRPTKILVVKKPAGVGQQGRLDDAAHDPNGWGHALTNDA